jgi:hypothetical protein
VLTSAAVTGEVFATRSETLNIGVELKRELELAARGEQRDATNLARLIIRQWLEARSADLARQDGWPTV